MCSINIGINCGKEAGQTVDHAHIHIIPRYKKDLEFIGHQLLTKDLQTISETDLNLHWVDPSF